MSRMSTPGVVLPGPRPAAVSEDPQHVTPARGSTYARAVHRPEHPGRRRGGGRAPGRRVVAVHLKLGPLSGVVKEALAVGLRPGPGRHSAGTARSWSSRRSRSSPTAPPAPRSVRLASVQELCCPVCGDADARGRQRPGAGSRRP